MWPTGCFDGCAHVFVEVECLGAFPVEPKLRHQRYFDRSRACQPECLIATLPLWRRRGRNLGPTTCIFFVLLVLAQPWLSPVIGPDVRLRGCSCTRERLDNLSQQWPLPSPVDGSRLFRIRHSTDPIASRVPYQSSPLGRSKLIIYHAA